MRAIIVDVLLGCTIALALLACAGVVLLRDALDRLHYAGPALLGGACAAGAVLVAGGPSLIGTRALLLAAILLATGPVLSHATARALHRRSRGR